MRDSNKKSDKKCFHSALPRKIMPLDIGSSENGLVRGLFHAGIRAHAFFALTIRHVASAAKRRNRPYLLRLITLSF